MTGIGIDIVELERIEKALTGNPRFLSKLFTVSEIEYYEGSGSRVETIAGFFAAKEAISKVLGTGISGFSWQDIEIGHTAKGQPIVLLHRQAKTLADQLAIGQIMISISHCKTYAVANAIGV